MGEKQMTSKYDGLNTFARIGQAAAQRKTYKALEEANRLANKQTQLMADRNRNEKAELARQAREAAAFAKEQNRLIQEGNRQKAALLQKEHAAKEAHRKKIEQIQRKELQRKEEIARREQSSRNKKSLLFEIHDDVSKTVDDPSYSVLDKYIHLCAAVDNIKINKIDQSITDNLSEKGIVQKMIDEVNNNFKSVRDNFSDQDQKDHDLLLNILETDEELEIKMIEDDIAKSKHEIVSAEAKIQEMVDSEIDNTNSEIDNINSEINRQEEQSNMCEHAAAEIQKRKVELLNLSLSEIISKFYKLKNNTLKKELVIYLKSKESNAVAKPGLLKDIGIAMFRNIIFPQSNIDTQIAPVSSPVGNESEDKIQIRSRDKRRGTK